MRWSSTKTAVIIVMTAGFGVGAMVAWLPQIVNSTPVSDGPKAKIEMLINDAKSTPPWQWLNSQSWEQHVNLIPTHNIHAIDEIEKQLLILLDDPTAPMTSRSTASYLLQFIGMSRSIKESNSVELMDVARNATWLKSGAFQFNALVDRDYYAAIGCLQYTLGVMKKNMDLPSALGLLRSNGWEIHPEDEVALRGR